MKTSKKICKINKVIVVQYMLAQFAQLVRLRKQFSYAGLQESRKM